MGRRFAITWQDVMMLLGGRYKLKYGTTLEQDYPKFNIFMECGEILPEVTFRYYSDKYVSFFDGCDTTLGGSPGNIKKIQIIENGKPRTFYKPKK